MKTLLVQSQHAKNDQLQQSQSSQHQSAPPQLHQQQESQPSQTGDDNQYRMLKEKIKNKILKNIPQQCLQEPTPIYSPECTTDSSVNARVESKHHIPPKQSKAQDWSSYSSIASRKGQKKEYVSWKVPYANDIHAHQDTTSDNCIQEAKSLQSRA